MNDLPQPATGNAPAAPAVSGGLNREIEKTSFAPAEGPYRETIGQPELPRTLEQAGVIAHPRAVAVSPELKKLGVAPAGENVVVPPLSQTGPLTDSQIAEGLKQPITSSWRWFSEWCKKRLKQIFGKSLRKT